MHIHYLNKIQNCKCVPSSWNSANACVLILFRIPLQTTMPVRTAMHIRHTVPRTSTYCHYWFSISVGMQWSVVVHSMPNRPCWCRNMCKRLCYCLHPRWCPVKPKCFYFPLSIFMYVRKCTSANGLARVQSSLHTNWGPLIISMVYCIYVNLRHF